MNIYQDYLELNESLSNPLIYCLTGRGFYSEINNLVNSISYCIIKKRRLAIDESQFCNGDLKWNDLYKTMLPSIEIELLKNTTSEWIIDSHKHKNFSLVRNSIYRRFKYKSPVFKGPFGFFQNIYNLNRQVANLFCIPKDDSHLKYLSLEPYAALHIRRGDKIDGYMDNGKRTIEGDKVSIDSYIKVLEKNKSKVKNVFVMTDDYSVLDELRYLGPNFKFFSMCCAQQLGYDQKLFNNLPPSEKKMLVIQLIQEAKIASRSEFFIGCFKSNVSRYIALVHKYPKNCLSVDLQKQWSPL